jgi:hypothetical protein
MKQTHPQDRIHRKKNYHLDPHKLWRKLTQDQELLLFPQYDLIKKGMRGNDEQQLDVFSYISPNGEFRRTTHCVRCVS